jgi:DNA adenine methylase
MKTPLTYYGGKQQLAATIIALVPAHTVYIEPFLGGAAIFFAKEPAPCEVINDCNGELINFYEVLKRDFSALQQEVEISLFSRKQHRHAEVVYNNPEMFDRVKRAWAVWTLANTSYGSRLDKEFVCDSKGKNALKLANKRDAFGAGYAARLQNTQIECGDALRIIRSRDTPETFCYCDPPYVGANQGHYNGYAQADFEALLDTLANMQGKFLLSSYRNDALNGYIERHGWDTVEIRMSLPMSCRTVPRRKIEMLTANYPIADKVKSKK